MAACSSTRETPPAFDRSYALAGPLVPATTTMVSAWDIPANPLEVLELDTSAQAARVRHGFLIFMNTPGEAGRLTHNHLSCGNCHLNAGQREKALPLVGVSAVFPQYNKRAGRDFTLADRVVGCFMRSQNATAGDAALEPQSEEVQALVAYL